MRRDVHKVVLSFRAPKCGFPKSYWPLFLLLMIGARLLGCMLGRFEELQGRGGPGVSQLSGLVLKACPSRGVMWEDEPISANSGWGRPLSNPHADSSLLDLTSNTERTHSLWVANPKP